MVLPVVKRGCCDDDRQKKKADLKIRYRLRCRQDNAATNHDACRLLVWFIRDKSKQQVNTQPTAIFYIRVSVAENVPHETHTKKSKGPAEKNKNKIKKWSVRGGR